MQGIGSYAAGALLTVIVVAFACGVAFGAGGLMAGRYVWRHLDVTMQWSR